jgi:hypothetical protein
MSHVKAKLIFLSIFLSYSGYDGAMRCLTENDADVAFTKVRFVRYHFGVSLIESSIRKLIYRISFFYSLSSPLGLLH